MFSPRLLAVLAVLAAVSALPATDKPVPKPVTTITDDDFEDAPWFSFPLFGNLFAPLWRLLPSFGDIGPRIVSDKDKFEVVVNVKDYKKDDLKVKVKGNFILVQGTHESKQDEHDIFASQFFHTYALPLNSSGDDVTAQLSSDGYLIVDAPLSANPVTRTKEVDRDVPITESGRPFNTKTETPENSKPNTTQGTTIVTNQPSTTLVDTDDRKEPTTPSTDSDKDNNIEHGNEVL